MTVRPDAALLRFRALLNQSGVTVMDKEERAFTNDLGALVAWVDHLEAEIKALRRSYQGLGNLSASVAILDVNLSHDTANFDELAMGVLRSSWADVKAALNTEKPDGQG